MVRDWSHGAEWATFHLRGDMVRWDRWVLITVVEVGVLFSIFVVCVEESSVVRGSMVHDRG